MSLHSELKKATAAYFKKEKERVVSNSSKFTVKVHRHCAL